LTLQVVPSVPKCALPVDVAEKHVEWTGIDSGAYAATYSLGYLSAALFFLSMLCLLWLRKLFTSAGNGEDQRGGFSRMVESV
jgi:hypothetical protein